MDVDCGWVCVCVTSRLVDGMTCERARAHRQRLQLELFHRVRVLLFEWAESKITCNDKFNPRERRKKNFFVYFLIFEKQSKIVKRAVVTDDDGAQNIHHNNTLTMSNLEQTTMTVTEIAAVAAAAAADLFEMIYFILFLAQRQNMRRNKYRAMHASNRQTQTCTHLTWMSN